MVFNATFNNISAISWRSVLLVEEPGENHWPATSLWQTLSHNVILNTHRHERDSVFKFWFKVKYLSTSKWNKLSFQPMKIPNEKHRFICTHLTGEQRKLNKVSRPWICDQGQVTHAWLTSTHYDQCADQMLNLCHTSTAMDSLIPEPASYINGNG